MRPPPHFIPDTPHRRRRSAVFTSVALCFIAPLFYIVCLISYHMEGQDDVLKFSISNAFASSKPKKESFIIKAASSKGGIGIPLVQSKENHCTFSTIIRHALRPLVPGL